MKLVVGVDDGIIVDLKRCVIVDHDALSESERVLLDSGTEEQAIAVAYRHGKSLYEMLVGCGYGDLNYSNAVAYSPLAIHDEISSRIDALKESVVEDDEKKIAELLEWALTLPEEELAQVGSFIVEDQSESVWGTYFANIILGVAWWHHITEREKELEDSGD